jgi:hypothetical protein
MRVGRPEDRVDVSHAGARTGAQARACRPRRRQPCTRRRFAACDRPYKADKKGEHAPSREHRTSMSHRTASALRMRKSPKQPRSRATVAAIVEATARVLGRRGWAGFTTEEVAQVAGVSIGSIYQYFPGRQMLLEAVRDRHFEQLISSLQSVRDDPGGVEQKARLLVEGLICAHAGDAGLRQFIEKPYRRWSWRRCQRSDSTIRPR